MSPQSPFRDAAARRDAIRSYRLAADRFLEMEETYRGQPAGEAAHNLALDVLRSMHGEINDPDPIDDPWCHCISCEAYIAAPSVLKLVPLDEAML